MEQVALRLPPSGEWTRLGGDDDARKPPEVVVRAFDSDVLFSVGDTDARPDQPPVTVPQGEGRRLVGRHFFVRSADPARGTRITYRGI